LLASVTVYVVLWPMTSARVAALGTVLTVLALSLPAALALSRFDGWWIRQIGVVANYAAAARR
jgi:hypothetical protein